MLATTGTVDFGGASFTARLVDYFLKKSIGLENINAETPERESFRKLLAFSLWKECERAKLDFEGSKQTRLSSIGISESNRNFASFEEEYVLFVISCYYY